MHITRRSAAWLALGLAWITPACKKAAPPPAAEQPTAAEPAPPAPTPFAVQASNRQGDWCR